MLHLAPNTWAGLCSGSCRTKMGLGSYVAEYTLLFLARRYGLRSLLPSLRCLEAAKVQVRWHYKGAGRTRRWRFLGLFFASVS